MLLKNMLYLKNKNRANFLHADTDPIIFGETVNLALYLCLLNAEYPLQFYLLDFQLALSKWFLRTPLKYLF